MTHHIDTHDDVALRDEEIIAFWAMAHNADDDRVPCGVVDPEKCPNEARWVYRHKCGNVFLRCDTDRVVMDSGCRPLPGYDSALCGHCGSSIPAPIPWLPM